MCTQYNCLVSSMCALSCLPDAHRALNVTLSYTRIVRLYTVVWIWIGVLIGWLVRCVPT